MSVYEVNRNTVQRRLDIRKAQRKEAILNAQQEAEDKAWREVINRNADVHRAEFEAAQAAQRREEERKAAKAAQQEAEAMQRQQRAEKEKRYCLYWYLYAFLTILPLLIATILVVVHEFGWLPTWILVPASIACFAFSIFNFVDLAPWIDPKAMKRFAAIFRRKLRAYLYTPYSQLIR